VASTITVDDVPRNDWGLWAEVSPGSHEVCFGAVAGYDVPSCRTVSVSAGETVTTTGTFEANPSAPGPTEPFGHLRVTTDPPVGAMISVDGAWRNNWGLDWLKLATGPHVVCWEPWPNTSGPQGCELVEVTEGETTTISGAYQAKGFLRVTTTPAVPGNIVVDGQVRNAFGMWTAMEPGPHTVCFGPVEGYATPSCQAVTVTAGATVQAIGTYTE
jgi:hypothetical protein